VPGASVVVLADGRFAGTVRQLASDAETQQSKPVGPIEAPDACGRGIAIVAPPSTVFTMTGPDSPDDPAKAQIAAATHEVDSNAFTEPPGTGAVGCQVRPPSTVFSSGAAEEGEPPFSAAQQTVVVTQSGVMASRPPPTVLNSLPRRLLTDVEESATSQRVR
jgi:hypothetical protein